ncbi:hypothetical protein [Streptomyces sp. NPDC051704]|uniref:hypothetical protein n=1 Tax=Streptomyces sp. NPDC051704 TaxID=3365671 RepID=UPI0037A0BE6F
MTLPDYDEDAYWTGLEDYEPDPVHDSLFNRTVRLAPPGDVWEASPREIRMGDWLVIDGTAYAITNMFSPGFDSSAKTVILHGHPPRVVKARHEIVRPYAATQRALRRSR